MSQPHGWELAPPNVEPEPPLTDDELDALSLRVAQANSERSRVKVLLGHGKALADWDEQNPAMRAQLVSTTKATLKDAANSLHDFGVSLVPIEDLNERSTGASSSAHDWDDEGGIPLTGRATPARPEDEVRRELTSQHPPEAPAARPRTYVWLGHDGQASPSADNYHPVVVAIATATGKAARGYVRLATWPLTPLRPAGRRVASAAARRIVG